MENYLFEENELADLLFSMFGLGESFVAQPEVYENHNSYLAKISMPGVNKSDVRISIEDGGYLKVTATNRNGLPLANYEIRVNPNISKEAIHANLENGTLYLRIDKVVHCLGKKEQSIH